MWRYENFSATRSHVVPIRTTPTDVQQIVSAIRAAESVGGVVRAVGSGWSYPDVSIGPEVTWAIRTDELKQVLNGTDPTMPDGVIPFALKDELRLDARHYVHVEAGIKIHDLNCELDAKGLAMITLGGSTGQSLAGVISTGTHGSDVALGPIPDVVQAIHLVGPGGQEWWIERAGAGSITDRTRLEQARDAGRLCRDIRIEYDDQLFAAVLVSAGRMGVVYSYVVRVRDAFNLKITSEKQPWSVAADTIRTNIRDASPPTEEWIEIVLNPYVNPAGDRDCVITRKKPTSDPATPQSSDYPGVPPGILPSPFELVCNIPSIKAVLQHVAELLPPLIAAVTATATAGVSWMLLIPVIGPELFATAASAAVTAATAALVALESQVAVALAAPGDDLAGAVVEILNEMTGLGHPELVPLLTQNLMSALRPVSTDPNSSTVGKSFQVLASQKPCGQVVYPMPCLQGIDGLEYTLDLSPGSEKLFGFIDDVLALSDEFRAMNMPIGFVASLRFTSGTEALIGMQQASRNCSVEFVVLRGLLGEDDFLRRLFAIARKHDAIPHWGLMHEIDGDELARLYGDRLRQWRMSLNRVIEGGGGSPATFRTTYSMVRGLEPLAGGLTFSNNIPAAISLWDPTPQAEGTLTATGFHLWNRSEGTTHVTAVRMTTSQDQPGSPVFRPVTGLPLSIAPLQTVLVDVTFSAGQAGPIIGMVEVDCDDLLTPTIRVPLSTSAIPVGQHAELQTTPNPLNLGDVLVNGSVGRNLTLTNTGGRRAGLDYVVTQDRPPGQFGIPPVLPRSLEPGESGSVYVSFNPTDQGWAGATLAIDVTGPTDLGTVPFHHRYEVQLAGHALRPIIFFAGRPQPVGSSITTFPDPGLGGHGIPGLGPGGPGVPGPVLPLGPGLVPGPHTLPEPELQLVDFGAVAPGGTATSSFWIRNIGDAPLTVQGIAPVPQDSFGVTDVTIFPATLAPNEEIEVPCNFLAYPVPGMVSGGEFLVLSDDPLRHTAGLRAIGRAAGPHLTNPPEVLDLGAVPPGPGTGTLTFRSDGTDPVTAEKVSLIQGTDFDVTATPSLPANVPLGSDLTVTVTLISTQQGQYQDRVVLEHDGNPGHNSQVILRATVD
jgi:hypothetical protein